MGGQPSFCLPYQAFDALQDRDELHGARSGRVVPTHQDSHTRFRDHQRAPSAPSQNLGVVVGARPVRDNDHVGPYTIYT